MRIELNNLVLILVMHLTITKCDDFVNISDIKVGTTSVNLIYDEEEIKMNISNIIRKHGYPCEEHTVETADGYILTLHRIPYGRKLDHFKQSTPVFLVHGLCFSSADFVITGPKNSLAYILADEGYDVWLANARGNYYSRRHTTWDPDTDANFWKFTWDEIGNYDHPASIDYILNVTRERKLHYIGHSQGSTTFFVMASLRPEYNKKILSAHALTGNVFFNHVGGTWWWGSLLLKSLEDLLPYLEMGEVFPRVNTEAHRMWVARSNFPSFNYFWRNFIGSRSADKISASVGEDRYPLVRGHTPAGCSAYQFIHFGQIFEKNFRRYNHGVDRNKILYGSESPPKYNLSKITAPVYIYYSFADDTSSDNDIDDLVRKLSNCKVKLKINDFSHFDFLYSRDARRLVYKNMVQYLRDAVESNDYNNLLYFYMFYLKLIPPSVGPIFLSSPFP